MFKFATILFALVAFAAAKPGLVTPLAYTAEVVAPAVATATSSQFFSRNHNGIAAPIYAPVAARYIDSENIIASDAVVAPVSPVATYAQTSYSSGQVHSAAPLSYASTAPLAYTSTAPLAYASTAPLAYSSTVLL
ncbi:hypothetical protein ACFFRR_011118 [Megaselia abdita]